MRLLLKYYDIIIDLPIGGGIPDSGIEKKTIAQEEIDNLISLGEQVNINTHNALKSAAQKGYSLALKEISRLKSENDRLRMFFNNNKDEFNYIGRLAPL